MKKKISRYTARTLLLVYQIKEGKLPALELRLRNVAIVGLHKQLSKKLPTGRLRMKIRETRWMYKNIKFFRVSGFQRAAENSILTLSNEDKVYA